MSTVSTESRVADETIPASPVEVRRGNEEVLRQRIRNVCRSDSSLERVGRELIQLLASQPHVEAVGLFSRPSGLEWRQTVPFTHRPELASVVQQWSPLISQEIRAVAASNSFRTSRLPGGGDAFEHLAVLAPFCTDGELSGVVCIVGDARGRTELSETALLTAGELTDALSAEEEKTPIGLTSGLDPILKPVLDVASHGNVARGYAELAAQLGDELNLNLFLIGTRRGFSNRCRLQATNGIPKLRRHSQLAACAEEVLNEAMLRKDVQFYDPQTTAPAATTAQVEMAKLCRMAGLVSAPILDSAGVSVGAWAGLWDDNSGAPEAELAARKREAVDRLSTRLSPCVELLRRLRMPPLQKLGRWLQGPSSRRRRVLLSAVAAITCLMALPLPYKIKCDGQVQAITRRYVPVPYAGVLREVLVEPGNVVQRGQILARMDDREIAWELAARQAEFQRAKKEYDVQLAGQKVAAAQVARLEMERLSQQISMLKNRTDNLDIRCPIEGVVVRGDARRKENARLSMGETLFEIAPLQKMAVEVFVPDEDIGFVLPGQEVKIRLDAFPNGPRSGTIRRVSPQAEIRAEQNVFVAKVALDNSDGALRPGMAGSCQVRSVIRPLGWNLFHRAWDRFLYLLTW